MTKILNSMIITRNPVNPMRRVLLFCWSACLLLCPVAGEKAEPEKLDNHHDIFLSPANPEPGAEFRMLLVSDKQFPVRTLEIICLGNDGVKIRLDLKKSGGGPPFWSWWQGLASNPGQYRLEVYQNNKLLGFRQFSVAGFSPESKVSGVVWKSEKDWDRSAENLFSAWLEALFQEAGEKDSWPNLDSVLKLPERNFLYNHLGRSEDNLLSLKPDCADNPFFLRAYFAWKNRLPFGFHECSRGSLSRPPKTGRWFHNELPGVPGDEVRRFSRFMRQVMDTVHSGTGRTALSDDSSDYFPLPLTRQALRPGSVYADPYGHTLVIVRWEPQTEISPGVLLAVDAQPDGTVGLKRFWQGNFLFATEEVVGQPGFKAFRPIIRSSGGLRLLNNLEISQNPHYGNYSLEQLALEPEAFYHKMESLINPEPLDPETALGELFQALYEQLQVRVESVENGEKYMRSHPGQVIPMPSGAAIFLTSGPWEDFSTPNRDLRLLIALDTIEELPEKVARYPDRFRIKPSEKPEEIKSRLKKLSAQLGRSLSISYRRSSGQMQTLTLEEILRRKEAFEMGYNPNDCPEIRWGAPPGSEEMSSCRRQAPAWQREKMEQLRVWFKKRLHPST